MHVVFCFLSFWSSLGMQVKQEALLKGRSVNSPRGNHLSCTLFPPEGSVSRVSGATAPWRDQTLTQKNDQSEGLLTHRRDGPRFAKCTWKTKANCHRWVLNCYVTRLQHFRWFPTGKNPLCWKSCGPVKASQIQFYEVIQLHHVSSVFLYHSLNV